MWGWSTFIEAENNNLINLLFNFTLYPLVSKDGQYAPFHILSFNKAIYNKFKHKIQELNIYSRNLINTIADISQKYPDIPIQLLVSLEPIQPFDSNVCGIITCQFLYELGKLIFRETLMNPTYQKLPIKQFCRKALQNQYTLTPGPFLDTGNFYKAINFAGNHQIPGLWALKTNSS